MPCEATCATWRSTTDVNSSSTTSGRPEAAASASARAAVTRNCSPVESAPNGRSQLGGEENPTAVSAATTSLMDRRLGNASSTLLEVGQSKPATTASPQSALETLVLPAPDGPTIRPTSQERA